MENTISKKDKESESTISFKNTSFPDITIDCYDNLIFHYSSNKCQAILKSITKEIDEKSLEDNLKEAFYNDNTNFELIKKIKETDNQNFDNIKELYEPLFKYNFKSKLFHLIELLKNYNKKEILLKYEINEIINNDSNELKDLINQFNKEINFENEKFNYMIIYYNWISNLNNKIYYYKNKKEFKYKSSIEINKKEDDDFCSANYLNSLNYLNQKISDLNNEIKKYLQLDIKTENKNLSDIIEKEINTEKIKESIKLFNNNNNSFNNLMDVTNEKIKKLTIFKTELNKHLKCLNTIDDFFTDFYEIYLQFLKEFLYDIPKTLNNLYELNYQNLNILDDFLFFLSFYDFEKIGYSDLIDYFEKTYEVIGEDYKIKDNNLILYNKIVIENYKNYNLNWSNYRKITRMKFKYEKYIKYNLVSKESLFCKYKNIYLKFFKMLFLDDRSCVKKLFLKTFPILKEKYFINEELLNYIFNKKIHIFNFLSKEFAGLTNPYTFNIYIKSNFENNDEDTIEIQICFYVAYIIILIHEIAHFIRLYIFKYTGRKEYEKSFDFDDETKTDIGFFIEKNLFGKIMGEINLLEAFYLIDIDNYYKDIDIFLKNFTELKKNKDKFDINTINDNIKTFLNNVDIMNLMELKNININSKLLIKGIGNNFLIGKNNDRFHFPQFIEEANKYLSKIMS